MAFTHWWSFTDGMVDSDRNEAGVYQFANATGDVVYIGCSNDLKRRLKEHLGENTTTCIKPEREGLSHRIHRISLHPRKGIRQSVHRCIRKIAKVQFGEAVVSR
jgi:hypothetical protein